jgi:hypothetical protein
MHELTIRIVGRRELELMLRLAGFEVEAVYGGVSKGSRPARRAST